MNEWMNDIDYRILMFVFVGFWFFKHQLDIQWFNSIFTLTPQYSLRYTLIWAQSHTCQSQAQSTRRLPACLSLDAYRFDAPASKPQPQVEKSDWNLTDAINIFPYCYLYFFFNEGYTSGKARWKRWTGTVRRAWVFISPLSVSLLAPQCQCRFQLEDSLGFIAQWVLWRLCYISMS